MCLLAADPIVTDNFQQSQKCSVMHLCYYKCFSSGWRDAWSSFIHTLLQNPPKILCQWPQVQGTINSLMAVQSIALALKAKGAPCQSISCKLKCAYKLIPKTSPPKEAELVLLGYETVIPNHISKLLLSSLSRHVAMDACTKWKRVFFTCSRQVFSPPLLPWAITC